MLYRRAPTALRQSPDPQFSFALMTAASRRHFNSSPKAMVDAKQISASEGEDAESLARDLAPLVEAGGRWSLLENRQGLRREFRFKTFRTTWNFMSAVATECGKQRHHPEWTNVYNKTTIIWTTHKPAGLSGKDVAMAKFCDEAAREHGEVVEGEVKGCNDYGK